MRSSFFINHIKQYIVFILYCLNYILLWRYIIFWKDTKIEEIEGECNKNWLHTKIIYSDYVDTTCFNIVLLLK